MANNVAYAGEMQLMEAKWTDKDGHLVRFKLVAPNEERPNPFKSYTKRRSGRGGTRFGAAVSHVQGVKTDEVCYSGELMLAGWADSSTHGYTVTFWCEPPETGMHAFEGYARGSDTFMVALMELDEDEKPIDQAQRERVERAQAPKRTQTLSQAAALLCANRDFQRWISSRHGVTESREQAAEWMRNELGIASRRELDTDRDVARRYHDEIRRPFLRWNEEHDPERISVL